MRLTTPIPCSSLSIPVAEVTSGTYTEITPSFEGGKESFQYTKPNKAHQMLVVVQATEHTLWFTFVLYMCFMTEVGRRLIPGVCKTSYVL